MGGAVQGWQYRGAAQGGVPSSEGSRSSEGSISEGREREGQRGGREGWRQEWGWYGRAAEREEGRVQQHRVSGMGRGQQGEGRRRRGSGMARINSRATTYFLRRLSRRHRLISDATAAHSLTYLGHVVGAQSFFGHGFFDAGAPQRGSMMVTLEQHTPRSGQEAAVHGLRMGMVRGAWFLHPIKNPGV